MGSPAVRNRIKRADASTARGTAEPVIPSRALAKGLEIIDTICTAKAPLPLAQIALVTRLGKASTLRLLQTLDTVGYIRKDESGAYVRGPRAPGSQADAWIASLIGAAREDMERLNVDLAETVTLAALMDDHIRAVYTIESPQHIRMSNYRNRILPPYASSLGKAISAYQTPERVRLLIQVFGVYQITDATITEPVLIREDLARVRERGFSMEFEETVTGGCCFGAAIQEQSSTVRAAVSVSLPVARLTDRTKELIPERVMQAAADIAQKLGR